MTERLYYNDPYLVEFDARVLDVIDVGGRAGLVLDRTAFYPTSGGQPFDTGTLGSARVVDVMDGGDGAILHIVEGTVDVSAVRSGDSDVELVAGRIDWPRRFEHMQQHTGQHVLSAAIDRLCSGRTQSFHLGTAAATIDLSRELSRDEITAAEDAANGVVWADRPVTISFVEADAAAALPLRKESVRGGTLRIVDIDGYDVSACGGTHVARTGEIGIIVVSGWERFRGGTRLEFKCGGRALLAHRRLRDTVDDAVRPLSVAREELPQAVERLQTEIRDLRRRSKDSDAKLSTYEAEALAARAANVAGVGIVVEALPDYDLNGLKNMAQAIVSKGRSAVILVTAASPVSLVIARAAGVGIDAAQLLKELTARFGGKGGGRPEQAQGGGLPASPDEIVAAAKKLLTASIPGGS